MASANYGSFHPDTPLLRDGSSLFSLTFEEFQNVVGEPAANLGSMNMDELLKNIWTAEESQAMAAAMNSSEGCNGGLVSQFSLQKQGSLFLPRTISGKTVEEVWKSLQPQPGSVDGHTGPHRQMTLGEVTLEDFLVKAGIVKERTTFNQPPTIFPANQALAPSNQVHQPWAGRMLGSSKQVQEAPAVQTSMSSQLEPIFQTSVTSNQVHPLPVNPVVGIGGNIGFNPRPNNGGATMIENGNIQGGPGTSNKLTQNTVSVISLSDRVPFDATERTNAHGDWMITPYSKASTQQNLDGPQLVQRQLIADPTSVLRNSLDCRNGPSVETSVRKLPPGLGAALGNGGLGPSFGVNSSSTQISFGAGSPLSPTFDENSSGTPLSVIAECGNGHLQRKRRCAEGPLEKVIERRQRRMIKNRESAARSRARKQAYTVELEAEVSQLKEENMKLLQKQEEEVAKRKKQIFALMPSSVIKRGYKGYPLKRTYTGPW